MPMVETNSSVAKRIRKSKGKTADFECTEDNGAEYAARLDFALTPINRFYFALTPINPNQLPIN